MRASIVALALAACTGTSTPGVVDTQVTPPIDTPVVDACHALEDRFAADLVRGPGTCKTDQDCAVVGGQVGYSYCDGQPSLGDCAGTPLAIDAPGYADAVAAMQQFTHDCATSGVGAVFDCPPIIDATCGANGHCTGSPQGSCFPPPPDAGP